MGLVLIQARFKHGAPSVDVIDMEVQRQLGSTDFLDSVEIDGDVVNILLVPDAVAEAYVAKAIVELRGVCVDRSGNPTHTSLPRYVSRPWARWPLWKRALFRIGL